MRWVPSASEPTLLLRAWGGGGEESLDRLAPLARHKLHHIAGRLMASQRPNHTLQTMALVNEAYICLADCKHIQWQYRSHFIVVSARLMRCVLVEVGMRFFGGFSVEAMADVRRVFPITAISNWTTANARPYRELSGDQQDG